MTHAQQTMYLTDEDDEGEGGKIGRAADPNVREFNTMAEAMAYLSGGDRHPA